MTTTTCTYRLAHRDLFESDWRAADAYHTGEGKPFEYTDLDDAIAATESCDETNGWDMIVVEMDGRNRPRVVYG